jgi:hypothetical protein
VHVVPTVNANEGHRSEARFGEGVAVLVGDRPRYADVLAVAFPPAAAVERAAPV